MKSPFQIFCFILLFCFGCEQNMQPEISDQDLPLFTTLNHESTGIEFRNDLKETLYMNGLFYEYYYNGGGVAVGDFNNDELPDIYFISNLESNRMYLNQGSMKFKDITKLAGVKGKSVFPTGVTTVDINSDGLLDIYISSSGRIRDPEKRRNELYVNKGMDKNGVPTFEENAKQYGLDIEEFSTQASFFDYDKDGDLDMFLINHDVEIYGDDKLEEFLATKGELSGERLYRNYNGKYEDVTDEAGIVNNRLGFGLGLAVGDLNNDGWPDVYVSHDFSGEDHLYLNNRNGTFSESVSESMRHISNFSMGNDIADYNNDGWLDVMSVDMVSEDNYGIKTSMSGMSPEKFQIHVDLGLHHQYMFNTLQLNNGNAGTETIPYFSEVAHLAGVSNTDWSWAPLFFDMNNNGRKDLFLANGIKRDFRNNDFVNYHKKVREELAKNKTINKEKYITQMMAKMPTRKKNNYFFLNNGDLTFSKMNKKWLLDSAMTCSNGAAYADFDNDGDVDVVVNNMDDFAYIYQNNTNVSKDKNYLKIKLNGSEDNSMGIGTRIEVKCNDDEQIKEQYLTRGFQSSVSEVMHFGLGTNEVADELIVIWADGKKQNIKNIKANQTLTLQYKNAKKEKVNTDQVALLFSDISNKNINHRHVENEYDDFKKESLLPHKMSEHGPALAVADINGDGLDDIFIGGALGYAGILYVQNQKGRFEIKKEFIQEREYEDVGAAFFDVDNDGDLDLYVVSGGNERKVDSKYYQDRIYSNNSGTFTLASDALPTVSISGSCVKPFDYDADGDVDLFIGGRQVPGKYPFPTDSYLLQNNSTKHKIGFVDVSNDAAPMLKDIGMVTDAVWTDVNNDGLTDLIVVGEWMTIKILKNQGNSFVDETEEFGLSDQSGWWSSIAAADFDNDGDMDLIAGNLGLNYKYKATPSEPFEIYAKDFDQSGNLDIVLGYYNDGNLFPLRGRECTSNQMPFVKQKFASYDAFGKATLAEVYGADNISTALHYQANTFATTYYENKRGMSFEPRPLTNLAQLSSGNTILIKDIDHDQNLDIILSGNMYGSEIETPRNDASYGMFLKGDGAGKFVPYLPFESGLLADGNIKASSFVHLKNKSTGIVFGSSDDFLKLIEINDKETLP
jgi:hypothetical protein